MSRAIYFILRMRQPLAMQPDLRLATPDDQSAVEDVDFAQAISDFNLQQAVYDASLKMGARALQNTLVNFL